MYDKELRGQRHFSHTLSKIIPYWVEGRKWGYLDKNNLVDVKYGCFSGGRF